MKKKSSLERKSAGTLGGRGLVLLAGARRPAAPLLLGGVLHPRAAEHVRTGRQGPHPRRRGDEVLLRRGGLLLLLLLHGAVGSVFARPPSLALDGLRVYRRDGAGAGGGAPHGCGSGGGVQQWRRRRVHLELHAGEGAPADGVEDRRGAHVHVGHVRHGADDGVHPGQRGRAMVPAAAAKGPVLLLLLLLLVE